jgi:hypothetical protein
MRVVIDTSSLLSLVRYYLPFDKNKKLFEFIKDQIRNHNIIIIDEVLQECEYVSGKTITKSLEYLTESKFKKTYKIPIRTKDLLPPAPKRFYNQVDNNFITKNAKRLDSAEMEQRKKEFLSSADARMIIFILNQINSYPLEEIILVTEETEGSNDQKAFKKIPAICRILDITVKTLPELFELFDEINIEIK